MTYFAVKITPRIFQHCRNGGANAYCQKDKINEDGVDKQFAAGVVPEATFYGFLGEAAFSLMTGLKSDLEYKRGGGGADFAFRMSDNEIITLDVKLNHKPGYECVFVRALNDRGNLIPIKYDLYVIGWVQSIDYVKQTAIVIFSGFHTNEMVNALPLVPARKKTAEWKNVEPRHDQSKNLTKLVSDLRKVHELPPIFAPKDLNISVLINYFPSAAQTNGEVKTKTP